MQQELTRERYQYLKASMQKERLNRQPYRYTAISRHISHNGIDYGVLRNLKMQLAWNEGHSRLLNGPHIF